MDPSLDQQPLVLASASPRRADLLRQLGLPFEVRPAHIDETPSPGEASEAYVLRMARQKAAAVATAHPERWVLAADTSVILDGEILGKPVDPQDARRMLRALAGRPHQVLSAVAIGGRAQQHTFTRTTVHFRALTDDEIAWYVATGEPLDKAGAYAVQGIGAMLVRAVEGSASGVIGLPMAETVALLRGAGYALPWSRR